MLQAIELSAESLANVKFIQEKKLIGKYFDEISQDTGKYCFGVDDTLKALEMGAVETLICWENLDIQVFFFCQGQIASLQQMISINLFLFHLQRVTLKNHSTGEEKILFLNSEQEKDKTHFMDQESGVELELEDNMPLLEWLANNYKRFGAALEIITGEFNQASHLNKHKYIEFFFQIVVKRGVSM